MTFHGANPLLTSGTSLPEHVLRTCNADSCPSVPLVTEKDDKVRVQNVLREESILADESPDLNTQVRTFVQFLKWLNQVHPCTEISCYGGGLRRLGYLSAKSYIHDRVCVCVSNGPAVGRSLWDYVHRGRRSTFNLKAAWRCSVYRPFTLVRLCRNLSSFCTL